MSLIGIIVTLVVVGVVLWLIDRYIPMNPTIKWILYVIVIIAVIWWLLQIMGLLSTLQTIRVPAAGR
jgi:ABC-type long-subunit fatty acid transport system fused permease/ATPase subunit